MKRYFGIAILATATSLAPQAYAVPITTWQVDVFTRFDTTTIQPTSGITVLNDQSLRWGSSTGSGQSGLDITDSPSTQNVNTDGAPAPNVSVTHLNRPITGTTLQSVDILSTLTITPIAPPGTGLPPATITFNVLFEETPNGANPCADGGANGVGVNVNGCADIFVVGGGALNFAFSYDDPDGAVLGRQYFASFFELTSGLNPLPADACIAAGATPPCLGFRTPESVDTTVQFATLITTERVRIPEPTTLALMGLGLAGLGYRRKKVKVA